MPSSHALSSCAILSIFLPHVHTCLLFRALHSRPAPGLVLVAVLACVCECTSWRCIPILTPSFPSRRSPPLDLTVSSMSVMTWSRVSPYFSSPIRTARATPGGCVAHAGAQRSIECRCKCASMSAPTRGDRGSGVQNNRVNASEPVYGAQDHLLHPLRVHDDEAYRSVARDDSAVARPDLPQQRHRRTRRLPVQRVPTAS